jgi:hypothetical protein
MNRLQQALGSQSKAHWKETLGQLQAMATRGAARNGGSCGCTTRIVGYPIARCGTLTLTRS